MNAFALHRRRPLALTAALVPVLLFALSACSTPNPPPDDDGLSLQGLWLVEPDPGTDYGSQATTTLEFGSAASGSATFLSQVDANDITICEKHVFAILADDVVLLDEEYYLAEQVDTDTVQLSNDTDGLTLTRVSGAPPVEPCAEATLDELATYPEAVTGFSSLSAFGTKLYFNLDSVANPIVSFDTATDSFGPLRTYTQSVSGGTHRMVVAARSDELFYGHCACGGSTSVNAFNLATNTSILDVETEDLGHEIGIRYGYFAGGSVTIGGRTRNDSDVNELLTLDPDTLTLQSSREVLPGASIDDVALMNDQLFALVNDDLILVGADGRAEQTYVTDTVGAELVGVAAIGSTLYVAAYISDDESALFEVTLP